MNYDSAKPLLPPFFTSFCSPSATLCYIYSRRTASWECTHSFARGAVPSKLFRVLATITGGDANSSISVGECVGGEEAGRRECWEQRQTSSIPELCAHIFASLSSRVSSADATARRKGSLLLIRSLPPLTSLRPFDEGVCVCLSAVIDLKQ